MTLLTVNMENVSDTVRHMLKTDKDTRSNDILLIMRVLERKGYIRFVANTRFGSGYFINQNDINTGRIPKGIIESIRRSRQKIQSEEPSLRPNPIIYNARLEAANIVRVNIKSKELVNGTLE